MRKALPIALVGGGVAALGALGAGIALAFKSNATARGVENAVATGGAFKAHLTGYWPFVKGLSAKERKMEGGVNDRFGKPLHTLEMHQQDPSTHPYVSVAGDYTIFPYGQRLIISVWPDLVFRVVDTGGHFFGSKKRYRVMGEEPLDICVDSSSTTVPKKNVTATIVLGDHFAKKGLKEVATGKFQGQTVSGNYLLGCDILGADETVGASLRTIYHDIVDPLDCL